MKSPRFAGRLVAECLGVVVLIALGPLAAHGQVTLKFWQPDTRADWVKARDIVIKDFEEKNPGIKVENTTVDWGQLFPKLQAAVAANAAPDIYFLNPPSNVYGAAAQKLIVPVTDVVKAVGADRWPTSMVDPLTVDGQVYGMPMNTFPHVVWYRKDLFAQAGLQPPTTLDNLLKAAQTLNKPPATYGIALYNNQADPHVFVEICAAFGCQVVDAKGNVVIDTPQTAQAIEYYKQLWKTTTPDAISKTNLDQRLVFAAGGAAIMMTQISLVTNLTSGQSKVSLDQAAVVEVPNQAKVRPTTVNEIQALTIPRGAKHPAEARRFLEFWFSPEEYMKYISNTVPGHLPTMKHATAAGSPYWELPRIKPMAGLFRVASESALQNGFYLGMYPVPNTCEPKVYAAGIYTQMVSHAVVDNWGGAQTAAWAQTEIKRLCAR